MESRLKYKKEQFATAIKDFENSLGIDISKLDDDILDSVKSGRAQKFEFCAELLWKTIKVFLNEIHGIDENSPKTVIKRFYSLGYVNAREYETLMEILFDRNKLNHIYNKQQFEEIYTKLIKTLPVFQKVLKEI